MSDVLSAGMAAGRWRVEGARGVWLVRGDARAALLVMPGATLSRDIAASRVDGWFPEGWGGTGTLASIVRVLEGAFAGSESRDAGQLKALLRRALRDGRVTAVKPGLGAPIWDAPEEEEPVTLRPVVREVKTWIEIVLVDDDDPPQPVAFAHYRIELPGGEVKTGMLDQYGRAKVVGIDPGMCEVSFPDFDERDWKYQS